MHEHFHSPQLRNRGYEGSNQDVWRQWLNTKGYIGRTTAGLEKDWLNGLGYSGPLNDMYWKMYRDAGLTGALDDMGGKWIVPEGGTPPVGPPIADELWESVQFFHDFQDLAAVKPAGGSGVKVGTSVTLNQDGVYGVPCLDLQPATNIRNALNCSFTGFTLDKTEGFTIDCWGKTIDIGPGSLPTWIECYNSAGGAVLYCGSSDRRGFTIGGSLGFTQTGENYIPHDDWTHVAYVVKGSTVKIYSEGVLIHTATFGSATGTGEIESVYIGCRNSGSYPYVFKGKLSQVRITKGERWTAAFTPPSGHVLVPTL